MPASRPIKELREKAAGLLAERLKSGPDDRHPGRLTVSQVSDALGISRQAVYDIKKGKYCPSLSLIHKMCETWGDKFDVGGIIIDRKTLVNKPQASREPQAVQGDLLKSLDQVDVRDFAVIATKPVGRALEITLRLTIPRRKHGAR